MRAPPKNVEAILHNNIRYEVQLDEEERFGQCGGVLSATDIVAGKECWAVKVYEQCYDPTFEKDVQEVFIRSMALDSDGDKLIIMDERQRKYVLNLSDGAICPISQAI